MATTENSFNGTGSQDTFQFTFPYLKDTDIKVSVGGVVKTVTTHYTLHTPTTIKFTAGNLPPIGTSNVRIYRETADTSLQATFYPGSAIRSGDLNDNFTQNLYVTQESNNDSDLALNNSREDNGDGTYTSAIAKATSATNTANTAANDASTAVSTANAASSQANTATGIANTATSNANTAKLAADRLVGTTANNGATWTLSGNNTDPSTDPKGVGYSVTTSETALNNSREPDGSGGFTTAIDKASVAKTTADTAKLATDRLVATTSDNGNTWTLSGNTTNPSTDPKGIGYAVTTAESASADASAAQAAVANSVLYDPIASVAVIPASPTDGDYIEVNDSTGIESFSPLSGLPSGFTGDPFLTARLKYVTNTWVWQNYFSTDPENRYVSVYGKHNTTQISYAVKVVTKTTAHRYHNLGSTLGYTIDGVESPFLTLIPGNTYRFDQSDSSNTGHPIAVYLNSDKSGVWTSGVTSTGTPGTAGAYTDLVISDTTPGSLSYQCQSHAYMGNGLTTNTSSGGGATGGGADQAFLENDVAITTDYEITTNKNAMSTGPLAINNGVVVTIPQNSLWKVI